MTWDVHDADGEVTTLARFARRLRTTPETAAKHLLASPGVLTHAPERLVTEAKAAARKKPGGGTPPPIATGNFVAWSNGKGRVDLLVSKGKVPGVDDDVEGTEKSPAARVTVWKDGKATREKRAFSTHTLRRIPPLDKDKKSAPGEALVALAAEHHEATASLPETKRLTGESIKAAFERGVADWPGQERTSLSPEEWGLGRAEHLVKVATGVTNVVGNDADLLPPEHPLAPGEQVTFAQIRDDIARLRAAAQ